VPRRGAAEREFSPNNPTRIAVNQRAGTAETSNTSTRKSVRRFMNLDVLSWSSHLLFKPGCSSFHLLCLFPFQMNNHAPHLFGSLFNFGTI